MTSYHSLAAADTQPSGGDPMTKHALAQALAKLTRKASNGVVREGIRGLRPLGQRMLALPGGDGKASDIRGEALPHLITLLTGMGGRRASQFLNRHAGKVNVGAGVGAGMAGGAALNEALDKSASAANSYHLLKSARLADNPAVMDIAQQTVPGLTLNGAIGGGKLGAAAGGLFGLGRVLADGEKDNLKSTLRKILMGAAGGGAIGGLSGGAFGAGAGIGEAVGTVYPHTPAPPRA